MQRRFLADVQLAADELAVERRFAQEFERMRLPCPEVSLDQQSPSRMAKDSARTLKLLCKLQLDFRLIATQSTHTVSVRHSGAESLNRASRGEFFDHLFFGRHLYFLLYRLLAQTHQRSKNVLASVGADIVEDPHLERLVTVYPAPLIGQKAAGRQHRDQYPFET